jgi:hypothetical protein
VTTAHDNRTNQILFEKRYIRNDGVQKHRYPKSRSNGFLKTERIVEEGLIFHGGEIFLQQQILFAPIGKPGILASAFVPGWLFILSTGTYPLFRSEVRGFPFSQG